MGYPALLVALHTVEYVNGQLIHLLGGDTRTLYAEALAYTPVRASQLGPGMCLHWFSYYWGERGIMQIKYYVMGHGRCVNVATLFKVASTLKNSGNRSAKCYVETMQHALQYAALSENVTSTKCCVESLRRANCSTCDLRRPKESMRTP